METVTWHGPFICQKCHTEFLKDIVSGWNEETGRVLRLINCPKCHSTAVMDKDENVNPNRRSAYETTKPEPEPEAEPEITSENTPETVESSYPPEFVPSEQPTGEVEEEAPSPDTGETLSEPQVVSSGPVDLTKDQIKDAKEEGGAVAEIATMIGEGKITPNDFTEDDFADFAAILWDLEIEGIGFIDVEESEKMEKQVDTPKHDKKMKRMGRAIYRINKRHPDMLNSKWGDILDAIILAGGLGAPVVKALVKKLREILKRKEAEKAQEKKEEKKD